MDLRILVLFRLLAYFLKVWGSPVINTPPELSVQENNAVAFTCTDTLVTTPFLMAWNKNDGEGLGLVNFTGSSCKLVLLNDAIRIRSERYVITCEGQGSTLTTTLVIPAENVTEYEHNTTWYCFSFTGNGLYSNKTRLFVLVRTSPVIKPRPELLEQENHAVSFTCTDSSDTFPFYFIWNRDDIPVSAVMFSDTQCQLFFEDDVIRIRSERYVITCEVQGSTLTTTLVIPAENVTEYEHNTTWLCLSITDKRTSSNKTIFFVLVPPKSPEISPNGNGKPVYTSRYNQTHLECVTSPCRPAARIDWFVDVTNVSSDAEYNIFSNYSGAHKLDGPRVSTRSTILIPWGESKGNETIKCVASNFDLSESEIKVAHIAPGIPSIISSVSRILAGDIVNLVCTETGGNPYSTFFWNGACVSNNVFSQSITFEARKQMNGQLCFCKTRAIDNTEKSVNINLTVYFPLEIQVLVPQYLNEGDELRVICNTFGNPNKLESLNLVHMVNDMVIRTFGSMSKEVTIAQASYQDSGIYKCEANNGIPDSQTRQIAQNVTIIKYPASFCPHSPDQLQFNIAINQSYTVELFFITTEKIDNVMWLNGTENMFNSSDVYFKLSATTVQCPFYGIQVNLSGYVAEMHIEKFQEYNKGSYSVEIMAWKKTSKLFMITPSEPPEIPRNFKVIHYDYASIILLWTKGSDKGYIQHFIIEYSDVLKKESKTINITEETDKDTYSVTLNNLQPSTLYTITLSAQNRHGITMPLMKQITTKDSPFAPAFGAGLATGVGICTAVVAISFIAWCLIKKKKHILAGKSKTGAPSTTGPMYEETAISGNKHIYMELEGVGQSSESTYHNTELQ